MHTLKNWTAKRSGPQMTVSGFAPDDRYLERRLKFSVVTIQGPCEGRMLSPASSIGIQRDGSSIALI
jgi:hypothetical protein